MWRSISGMMDLGWDNWPRNGPMGWGEAEVAKGEVTASITIGTNSSVWPTVEVLHNLVPTDLSGLFCITFLWHQIGEATWMFSRNFSRWLFKSKSEWGGKGVDLTGFHWFWLSTALKDHVFDRATQQCSLNSSRGFVQSSAWGRPPLIPKAKEASSWEEGGWEDNGQEVRPCASSLRFKKGLYFHGTEKPRLWGSQTKDKSVKGMQVPRD